MAFYKEKRLRQAFNAVKEELDDHLDAINDNTEEILENRAMILELQERMCKLSDRLSELSLRLEEPVLEERFSCVELSLREQEVFLSLYTASAPASYAVVSRQLSLPVPLLQELVGSIIGKGVPVQRTRDECGDLCLSLDPEFVELQSKHNIIGINNNISAQLSREFQQSLL
jgi:hypothetical protein